MKKDECVVRGGHTSISFSSPFCSCNSTESKAVEGMGWKGKDCWCLLSGCDSPCNSPWMLGDLRVCWKHFPVRTQKKNALKWNLLRDPCWMIPCSGFSVSINWRWGSVEHERSGSGCGMEGKYWAAEFLLPFQVPVGGNEDPMENCLITTCCWRQVTHQRKHTAHI